MCNLDAEKVLILALGHVSLVVHAAESCCCFFYFQCIFHYLCPVHITHKPWLVLLNFQTSVFSWKCHRSMLSVRHEVAAGVSEALPVCVSSWWHLYCLRLSVLWGHRCRHGSVWAHHTSVHVLPNAIIHKVIQPGDRYPPCTVLYLNTSH